MICFNSRNIIQILLQVKKREKIQFILHWSLIILCLFCWAIVVVAFVLWLCIIYGPSPLSLSLPLSRLLIIFASHFLYYNKKCDYWSFMENKGRRERIKWEKKEILTERERERADSRFNCIYFFLIFSKILRQIIVL